MRALTSRLQKFVLSSDELSVKAASQFLELDSEQVAILLWLMTEKARRAAEVPRC